MTRKLDKKVVKKEENELAIKHESVFLLENITLKKDTIWRMKLTLKKLLPQSYREYFVRLSVNEAPFEMRIEDLKRKRLEVESENQLFGDQKKRQLSNIDDEIKEVEKELSDMVKSLPVIEFDATIEALAYKDSDTVLVLMIPSASIDELNTNRSQFSHYKIELIQE